MKAEIVTSLSELERLKESLGPSGDGSPTPEVFHAFAWARAWWEGYGRCYGVFSPVVRDANGEGVAIWPLVRHKSEIRPFGDSASDHNDLLASPAHYRQHSTRCCSIMARGTMDLRYRRCGGAPIKIGGKFYRLAQNCADTYGGNL
jgi:hypothetical protein